MIRFKHRYLYLLFLAVIFLSCSSDHFSKTPINQFEGLWELKGREIFNEMQVDIKIDKDGKISSKIVKLNKNKYVQLFLSEGDDWIKAIKRSSNFEFVITEKKLAAPLFSQYGNSTVKKWNVAFKGKDCFGISETKSPEKSSMEFCRVK
jgi:hypothetical protein